MTPAEAPTCYALLGAPLLDLPVVTARMRTGAGAGCGLGCLYGVAIQANLAAQGVVWLHKKPDPGLFRSVFVRAPFPGGTFTCQVPLHYAGTTIHQEIDIHCNAFLCIILDLLKFGFPAPFMVISIEASLESLANGSNPNAHSS